MFLSFTYIRFRELCKKDKPAKNTVDDIDRTEEEIAQLTTKQYAAFRALFQPQEGTGVPLRIRLKAPAGAGKTFMAIKLAADLLNHPWRYPRMKHLVIVTHSAAVLYGLMKSQLQKELGADYDQYTGHAGLSAEPHSLVLRRDNLFVTMITIDYLLLQTCDVVKAKSMSAEEIKRSGADVLHHLADRPAPSVMIVDEAHHVFSYQPNPAIFGQHMLPEPGAVAAVVNILCGKKSSLVVLYDRMQSFSASEPVYPKKLDNHSGSLDEILRMSLRTMDAASPFCFDLENRGLSERAVATYYPEHENSIEGKDPQYFEVKETYMITNNFQAEGVNIM